jgi:hypothetical protein
MDASWVAAIASVASALIVGVAAIAAVLQIRHIRNANDTTIYLKLVDGLESAQSRAAFEALAKFAAQFRTDVALRDRLAQPNRVPEFDDLETLLRTLDEMTMLILTGSVREELILAKYADEIVQTWDPLAEAVYIRRAVRPHFASLFEHLAMRAKAYLEAGEIDRFYGGLQRDPRMRSIAASKSR